MLYDPKIYIRDYGTPTKRMLAFSQGYDLEFMSVGLRRSLIIHAENLTTGEEFLLLSGDVQSGSDLLDMSGSGNDLLVLANDSVMRFFGADVALQYSNISGFPSWSYDLVFNDAGLRRDLFVRVEASGFAVATADALLIRSLLMLASGGSFSIAGSDANFITAKIIAADAASYTIGGFDAALLRQLPMVGVAATFAWAGSDAALTRSLVLSASTAAYATTFNDALIGLDNIEALSGDASSGSDLSLLSGDAQTGEDFLLFSQ